MRKLSPRAARIADWTTTALAVVSASFLPVGPTWVYFAFAGLAAVALGLAFWRQREKRQAQR